MGNDGLSGNMSKQEALLAANLEFEDLVKKYLPFSTSMNQLCRFLGLKGSRGYYDKIGEIIDKLGLSTAHFKKGEYVYLRKENLSGTRGGRFIPMDDDEYFVKGVKRHGATTIKHLIKNGHKAYQCEICGISQWIGKPLRLQVHHINGDHYDNRLANLQILCPNCHTQTDNYARRGNSNTNSFRITKRVDELVHGNESSYRPLNLGELLRLKITDNSKTPNICQVCGREIVGDGEKYCSHECAYIASRKFDVTKEQLERDFAELKSYRQVGKKYGVSDNAVKKRAIKLGIFDDIQQHIKHR